MADMSSGYSKAFNDATRPGFSPEAAEAAMRRVRDAEQIQNQQAFQRQVSGAAADSGEMTQAVGARHQMAEEADREEKERKERLDREILLQTIEQAQAFADQRGAEADAMEAGFEARFGDAWREEIANRVFEPDDVPEWQQESETLEEYRERLADELIEQMIDPQTGEIRPEYANNPELRQYAEWALLRHQERDARAYIERRSDPNLTPEQQRAEDVAFAATATGNEIRQAAQEAARDGENINEIERETNARNDVVTQTASLKAGANSFG